GRETDDNLSFVRDRLLRSEADLASLLDLYGQVRRGKPVRPDDTNPLIDLLRLSGVARLAGNRLVVRNRIYDRVFAREWVIQRMPVGEVGRQRARCRRAWRRPAAIAAVIVTAMGLLTYRAVQSDRTAKRAQLQERQQRLTTQSLLYASQLNLAH